MKYLILGAGPSGLIFANMLKDLGETSYLVLEAEETAGGLCRSEMCDGSPLDIGGGHFLDVRRPAVVDYLFRFMPESEWNKYDRDSRISIGGQEVGHPLEANIWQLDTETQIEYLISIARASSALGTPKPERFVDWIRWKLGDRITDDYMLPYNAKMFGDDLDQLGTYWLDKLPDVSLEDTLRSCLMHQAYGKQPGHAQFYYPHSYGYGEVWLRLADSLGDHIEYGRRVCAMDVDSRTVRTADGSTYQADCVITTIPWRSVDELTGLPTELRADIERLISTAVVIDYKPETMDTDAQWIYYPDPELDYHRILVRSNFVPGGRGYWTETRSERFRGGDAPTTYLNEYAYPLNTIDKPTIMDRLLTYTAERSVHGLGRWGEHMHYNSDVVVERAMELARRITGAGGSA